MLGLVSATARLLILLLWHLPYRQTATLTTALQTHAKITVIWISINSSIISKVYSTSCYKQGTRIQEDSALPARPQPLVNSLQLVEVWPYSKESRKERKNMADLKYKEHDNTELFLNMFTGNKMYTKENLRLIFNDAGNDMKRSFLYHTNSAVH